MKIIFFLSILLLTSCGKMNVKPDNTFVIIHPDPVPTLELQSPEWTIANQEKLKVLATDPSKKDLVWYILDPDDFKLLMSNLIEISDKVLKQDSNLKYYKDSIDEYDKKHSK